MAWFVRSDASKSLDSGRKTARPDSGRARTIGQLRLWRSLPVQDYPGRGAYLARLGRPVRPPTRPAPTRPPAFPPARPNSARARASLRQARACCSARCTPAARRGWAALVLSAAFKSAQCHTPAHGWRASPTAQSAHCRAWACAAPMVPGPYPPRLARQTERGPPQPVWPRLSCPAPPCPARTSPAQPPGPCRSAPPSRAPVPPGSGRGAGHSPRGLSPPAQRPPACP
jgi:hypothetical protein